MKGGSRPVSLPKAISRARRRVENLLSVARTWPVVGSEEPEQGEVLEGQAGTEEVSCQQCRSQS